MGEQRRGYARRLRAGLRARLGTRARRLAFAEVRWADILGGKQERLLQRLRRAGPLRYPRLRRFVVAALGDAVAYQPVAPEDLASGELDVYARVHERLARDLERLARRAGARAPLTVVAHSLGTVIVSNYLWDCQQGRFPRAARSPLARGETLAHLVFLGSSLPLWSLRYREYGTPIRFPVADARGEWLCFYDPDDVLGYPLRPINRGYSRAVTRDVAVEVGGPLTTWNPLAHLGYWGDRRVLDEIARLLGVESAPR
jgi:hypothetical protein